MRKLNFLPIRLSVRSVWMFHLLRPNALSDLDDTKEAVKSNIGIPVFRTKKIYEGIYCYIGCYWGFLARFRKFFIADPICSIKIVSRVIHFRIGYLGVYGIVNYESLINCFSQINYGVSETED